LASVSAASKSPGAREVRPRCDRGAVPSWRPRWSRCADTAAGPIFWRFGRDHREPLLDAIGNARRDAYLARRRQAAREEQRRRQEREAAQRETRRPVCKDCGQKFTDDRWEEIGCTRDWSKRQSHPHLCENCQDRAVAAEQQAEADERERQEQESAAARRRRDRPPCRRPAAGFPASAPDAGKPRRPTTRASPRRLRARLRCRWRLQGLVG
jgi:hypothetical protein